MKIWSGQYFKPHEFACKCGHSKCQYDSDAEVIAGINPPPGQKNTVVDVADEMRFEVDCELIIASGWRGWWHKLAADKRRKYGEDWVGAHGAGWAVDIRWPKNNPRAVAKMELTAARMFLEGTINDIGIANSYLHIGLAHPNDRINRQWLRGSVRKYNGLEASPPKMRFFEFMRRDILAARRAG